MSLGDDAGSLAGIGLSAATGNWISAGIGIVGLGTSLFGGLSQANAAKQEAQVSANITGLEQNQNDVRQAAMHYNAQRSQLEIVRNAQRARAMSIQSSTTQGAQYGTGAYGGQAETTNEGYYGLQGVNSSVQFGDTMFGIDKSITAQKMQLASLKGQEATDQGIASIGGALMKAAGPIGNISGSAFGGASNGLSSLNWLSGGPTGFLHG